MSADLRALAARVEAEEPSVELEKAISVAAGYPLAMYPYLRSLDAAMQLVPEGLSWRVDYGARHRIGSAFVILRSGGRANGDAKTPAAALTAAALRARAEQESER